MFVGSDCLSVHVNDVQKKCVEHYVCVCVCAHLNRCPPLFFHFTCPHYLPSHHPNEKNTTFFFVSTFTPHTSGKLFIALFFFFTLAHHQLGWPLVKKQHSGGGGETMQMEERTRPGGPRCALCAGESKRKKKQERDLLVKMSLFVSK